MNASMVYQSAMAAALAAPIESPLDYLERQHGFVTIKTSAGGSARVRNCADRLREFADTVRKNWAAYGGGAKPAELAKPRKPRAIAAAVATIADEVRTQGGVVRVRCVRDAGWSERAVRGAATCR